MREWNMIKDLTKGSPDRLLWTFTLPMLGSVVFQQLYNIVDSVVAGKFIGDEALAAVGASYPITMIFMAVAIGMNVGCSVIISQLFGAGQYGKMKTAIFTSLISSAVLSLVMTFGGLVFCSRLLRLLNTPDNIFGDSEVYLVIYTAGLLFVFLYNICTGTFTALGDSMTPLCFLVASSLGNIALDLFFVIGLKMGVSGVAWATFIAQGIAAILVFAVLLRRLGKIEASEYRKFSVPMLGRIARMAVPSILQQSFVSVGNLFVQGVVNSYGSAVIAGYSAAIKLNTFTITLFTTLSSALSSFSAQNIGAGLIRRVRDGMRSGVRIALAVSLPFTVLYLAFGGSVMRIFVSSTSADVIAVGKTFLGIVAPFYFPVSIKLVCDGVLRGGEAIACFMFTTFSDLILRVVLVFILPLKFGSAGIWMAWPIGWIVAMIFSLYFYKTEKWNHMNRNKSV